MKLTIHTVDGGHVEVKDFDQDTAVALVEAIRSQQETLQLVLDDSSTTYIRREAIVRVDFD